MSAPRPGIRTRTKLATVTDLLAEELLLVQALVDAQRALLSMRSRADARDALIGLVERLGGAVVPADPVVPGVLPLDLSVGHDAPVLAVATPGTPVRARLERTLPELVQQAQHLAAALDRSGRGRQDGDLDRLTGAPDRRWFARALERAVPGEDRLVGFLVGGRDWLIEPFGRTRSDALVRSLADLVRSVRHPCEPWGRLDGPGVAVLALRADERRTSAVVGEVLRRWPRERGLSVDLRVADVAIGEPPSGSLSGLESALAEAVPRAATADDPGAGR